MFSEVGSLFQNSWPFYDRTSWLSVTPFSREIKRYIYIFIAIALDETIILVAVNFSMQSIYQSRDLYRALEWNNVNVSQ